MPEINYSSRNSQSAPHIPPAATPLNTPFVDGCIDPRALSEPGLPAIVPLHTRAHYPSLPSITALGIPKRALAGPPPFPGAVVQLRPVAPYHPQGAPSVHHAILARRHAEVLSTCLRLGDQVAFRVPRFRGHAQVDAIDLALITGQGANALFLCAFELSRLMQLPWGYMCVAILARSAATGNAASFERERTGFGSYMRRLYGHSTPPEVVAAEANHFARAACGYAMLACLHRPFMGFSSARQNIEHARMIGALMGLSAMVPFESLLAACQRRELEASYLNQVTLAEVPEEVQALLDNPHGAETFEALMGFV